MWSSIYKWIFEIGGFQVGSDLGVRGLPLFWGLGSTPPQGKWKTRGGSEPKKLDAPSRWNRPKNWPNFFSGLFSSKTYKTAQNLKLRKQLFFLDAFPDIFDTIHSKRSMKMKSKNIRNIRYLSLVPILIKLLNILTREDDHWTIQRRRVRWRGWDGLSEDGVAFPLRHDYHLKRTYSRSSFS